MSVHSTHRLFERYFAAMNADEDFSQFYTEDVTWVMVDSGQEVRGAAAVRDHILDLHSRMRGGNQRPLALTDSLALLEGDSINLEDGEGPGLSYCLVYDVSGDRIGAMRCYGTLSQLMMGLDEVHRAALGGGPAPAARVEQGNERAAPTTYRSQRAAARPGPSHGPAVAR